MVVRIDNNIVVEIIPDYALPVEKWYGEEFAKECIEVPDTVTQGMIYNQETKTFSEPEVFVPVPTFEQDMMQMIVDQQYEITLLQLGI